MGSTMAWGPSLESSRGWPATPGAARSSWCTGMLASALSMGSSAYLAAKSQREVYEGEIAREKSEIEENPEEERQELELFYQLKGFTEEKGRTRGARIQEKPAHF